MQAEGKGLPGAFNFNRPLLAVTACYAAGIALGWVRFERPLAALWLLGLVLLMAAGAVFRRFISLFVAVLFLVACAAGAASFFVSAGSSSGNILYYSGYPVFIEGTVMEEPLRMEESTSYHLRVETVETNEGRFPVSGKVLVKVYGGNQEPYWFGERLRLRGMIEKPQGRRNPGGFDYRFYLRTRGISGIMYLKPYQVLSLGPGEVNRLADQALALRIRLVEGIRAGLSSPCAELLSAILFGQRHSLPESVQENFMQSGVSHLLAVSGLHVGLVAALFLGICRRLGIRGRLPPAAAIVVIFGYAYLTGMRPPALRAAVMFSMASGALLLDRENDLPTAISLAALLTLVLNPLQLFTAGFQLSYAATLAIIYGSPPLTDLFRRCKLPSFIRSLAAVTLAAQLGVLPLCAVHFQHIPLGALWFNLLLLPVMPLLVGLGLAAALLQLILPAVARLPFAGAGLLLKYILAITGFSRFAGFYIPVYTSTVLVWVFYYFGLGMVMFYYYRRREGLADLRSRFALFRNRRSFALQVITLAVAIALVWGGILFSFPRQKRLTVTFIDVGQGASALVESGRGRVLIDCGGEVPFEGGDPGKTGEQVLLPFLRSRGVRTLDLVIITHPHEDHFGGLGPLLNSVAIKSIWISPQPGESPYYTNDLVEATSRGIPVTEVEPGRRWTGFGLTLEVLGPPQPLHSGTGSDENNNSIVLRLLHPMASFLFCGDIEQDALLDLLRRQPSNLKAKVLLVPHHGGFLPDLPRLIEAVHPRIAVIQVGRNTFGHPHPSTLEALQQAGVSIFRNDLHGAVIISADKTGLAVKTMSGEKQGILSDW